VLNDVKTNSGPPLMITKYAVGLGKAIVGREGVFWGDGLEDGQLRLLDVDNDLPDDSYSFPRTR
jgi:hypothetical protein